MFSHIRPTTYVSTISRLYSTLKKSPIGFVFDIDGVLMQSKNAIKPHAFNTLNYLNQNKIPYVLLTNGGGQTEQSRIDLLNESISPDENIVNVNQLVQSHTPMKNLIKEYKRVLIIGGADPLGRDVALSYGFEEVIRPIDIVRTMPNIWPFIKYTDAEILKFGQLKDLSKPIDAVLVFNDPRDMGTDLQIILDYLNSENGILGTKRDVSSSIPSVPIIWSNMDLLWSTGFKLPRFGQGAFRLSVRELYKSVNDGLELNDLVLGKPWPVSFAYAESILNNQWKILNGIEVDESKIPKFGVKPQETLVEKVYMVGDNPASDIKGGNDYGWETILVETGVYKDGDFERDGNLSKPTLGTFDNVWDGVNKALKHNGIQKKAFTI